MDLDFDHKSGNPEDFLVQLQIRQHKLTLIQYSHQFLLLTYRMTKQKLTIQHVQGDNQATLDNALNERNRRIKEIVMNAIPNLIKRKLLDQIEAATVQDLCTVARRQLVFFELCTSDDWTRDAFNEVSSTLWGNLVEALTKLTQQEEKLEQQQKTCLIESTPWTFRTIEIKIPVTTISTFNIDLNNCKIQPPMRIQRTWLCNNSGRGRFNNNRDYFNDNQNRNNYNPYSH